MKNLVLLICILSLITKTRGIGQEHTLKNVPAQFTFLYPLGTLYDESGDYEINLSLNALSGLNGAINGLEWGGISNTTLHYVKGIQAAGIANINHGYLEGIQFAGIYNRSKKVDGIQIAGIINKATTLSGLQVGLINVVDSLEDGFSMGLLNIYKHGAYTEWELSSADYAQVRLSYKLGSKNFYTIFTAGANTYERKHWIMGIGFGHIRPISETWSFQPEIIGLNYSDHRFSLASMISATHFKMGFVKSIHEKFAISIAPGLYWAHRIARGEVDIDLSPFNPIWRTTVKGSPFQMGYGLSVAIQFK